VLVAACRTPIGTAGHALAGLTVVDLAAPVLADLVQRAAPLGLPVDEVVLGNCLGPGGNPARSAALAAGLGAGVPAVTVDRQCGSGLQAVRQAAAAVTRPSGRNAGRSRRSRSRVSARGRSSVEIPFTATISRSNRPAAAAASARSCDRAA
jgi:hypothetical protein